LWDAAGSLAAPKGKSTAAEMAALWSALDDDAPAARRALARLSTLPAEAVRLLSNELKPAPGKPPSPKEVERLIADLDDESFEVRENASRALAQAGQVLRPTLVEALKAKPRPETRRRLQELLDALKPSLPPREHLRPTRALELLERLGTPEA